MSINNENGINNDENNTKDNEDSLFNLEDDDHKQELNEDNQLKCFLCKQIYNQPKFLSCTHSFCLQCCEKLFQNNPSKDQIQCPLCQQITEISNVNILVDNYLLIHQIEELALEKGSIECRACTSNDVAVAHCSTCSCYLCEKCCQAHQYMKCFEQHQVRRLSEITNEEINSTGKCSIHPKNETICFCITCSLSLCDQCLPLHPTPQHDLHKNQFEQIHSDFNEKIREIDHIRSNALTYLDNRLTSLQQDYDKARTAIDVAHSQYQQVLSQVYQEFLSSLNVSQRDEEMRLIDKLETIQKGSQSFDDSRTIFDNCLKKCSLNELVQLKTKIFDEKIHFYHQLFFNETTTHDEQNKNESVQFLQTPNEEFQQIIKHHFGQLIKPSTKETSLPNNTNTNNNDNNNTTYQRGSLNGDSVSTSSGVGSLALGQTSSHGTILSNGGSPSASNRDDYFINCQSNETEPVVENLRALESIFVNSLSSINPNVQSNLEQILQINQQQESPYSILTRQTSAPPLGQRSPPSNLAQFPPPSLLATYPSTNSGGSSNGNNSRSTTPFSGATLNPVVDLNLNGLSQTSLLRRSGQSMQVRAKFGSLGPQKCQFNAPHGFCLGIDEEIIVADTNNHRIQIFDKNGEYKYQFGMPGKEEGQLWYPRKVAVIRQSGKFVVCDRGNERSRMQIFTRNGHFVRKISIRYIDIVAGLAITQQGHIVAVDSVSPTVFCISESGELLKWFDCSDYMREPSDIAIFNNEYFVCDFKGHCVAVFDEDGAFLRRIGSESITNFPNGIDISDAGDVIIGDSHGNRFHIAVFSRTGDFLQEFDCPYVKVSRCCGLKITSDGYIVTLAKNNHHVLVLNTLYLT